MKIAVAISVHNRHEMAKHSVEQWKKYLPEGAALFIVDDGSDEQYPNSDFRFETPQGIAVCKNKCLELCEDADFIFLSDDDNYPKQYGWHQVYIEAYKRTRCNHFSLTWDRKANGKPNGNRLLKTSKHIKSYSNPSGVMLFFTKQCLETVGGFDTNFGRYGNEHVDLSRRIHNAGLTPYPFCDVHAGLRYFHPLDYYGETKSTMANRKNLIVDSHNYLISQLNSKEFKPYK